MNVLLQSIPQGVFVGDSILRCGCQKAQKVFHELLFWGGGGGWKGGGRNLCLKSNNSKKGLYIFLSGKGGISKSGWAPRETEAHSISLG